jgi:hypothetical protein
MGYRVKRRETIEGAVHRIARRELTRALAAASLEGGDPTRLRGAVHEARRRLKRVRALLRLVAPVRAGSSGRDLSLLREATRQLSRTRDAHAVLDTFDGLRRALLRAGATPDLLDGLRGTLVELAGEPLAEPAATLAQVRPLIAEARELLGGLTLTAEDLDAVLPGLDSEYRRGLLALSAARTESNKHHRHGLRRPAKRLATYLRLLRGATPKRRGRAAERFAWRVQADALTRLARRLGSDHDLGNLKQALRRAGARRGLDVRWLLEVVEAARVALDQQLQRSAELAFGEAPEQFAARMAEAFVTWRSDGRGALRAVRAG